MFDRVEYNSETKVCPITQVVEKSITPDKVTDLYKEVTKEVKKSIVQSIEVRGNLINGVAVEMKYNVNILNREIIISFILNGEKNIMIRVVELMEESFLSKEELFRKLLDHYKEEIAMNVMKSTYKVLSL